MALQLVKRRVVAAQLKDSDSNSDNKSDTPTTRLEMYSKRVLWNDDYKM
jgi:hypothetical protein